MRRLHCSAQLKRVRNGSEGFSNGGAVIAKPVIAGTNYFHPGNRDEAGEGIADLASSRRPPLPRVSLERSKLARHQPRRVSSLWGLYVGHMLKGLNAEVPSLRSGPFLIFSTLHRVGHRILAEIYLLAHLTLSFC